MIRLTALMAAALACIHLFAARLTWLDVIPRSRWLSAAGGISVAYVFVHILPELAHGQERLLAARLGPFLGSLEHHIFLLALLGLSVFYGLERSIRLHRRGRSRGEGEGEAAPGGVFWLHLFSFSLYNLLIGYLLLHREAPGLRSLWFFFIAMAMHFAVNDYGLRRHYGGLYRRVGRWILAAAVLGGWAAGALYSVGEVLLAVLFALLSGGVILNVLKEELPEERESRFWAFAAGAWGYAGLLLWG